MFDPTKLEAQMLKRRGVIPVLADRVMKLSEMLMFGTKEEGVDLANELRWISQNMRRRTPVHVAPVQRRKATRGLRPVVCDFADAHPEMDNQKIGERFNISLGRVSEYRAGYAWENR